MKRLLIVLIAALMPSVAVAQESKETGSPRNWMLDLHFGRIRPNIDAESGLAGQPYNELFGKKTQWLFGAQLEYQILSGFGTLSVGLAGGYANVSTHGIVVETGERAPDLTSLRTVPVRALAVYRFDWLLREIGIPLVPYGKAGVAYTLWWIDGGRGVAKFEGDSAIGGKWGYQLSGGLALELNFFDRGVGREFDQDFGVNSVYLTAEYMRLTADNFGGEGFDLSDDAWMFGMAFEF